MRERAEGGQVQSCVEEEAKVNNIEIETFLNEIYKECDKLEEKKRGQ